MTSQHSNRQNFVESSNLADLYGLPLVDWSRIEDRLAQGVTQAPGTGGPDRHTGWLATINRDGSPHVTGVGALWVDGTFWFETGVQTVKGRNLSRDPRCTLSLATHDFDLVVDGVAEQISDPATVAAMAARWRAQGWPAQVDASGIALTADYSAPSAGPPPWGVYRLRHHRAMAVATIDPGGATRWRFAPD
jgi:PPOX class probable F420-dependent enzyme